MELVSENIDKIKYETLAEGFKAVSQTDKFILFIGPKGEEEKSTYEEIYLESCDFLAVLQKKDVKKGDFLIFQLRNERNFIVAFWACILGGIIAIPLAVSNEMETEAGKKFIRICNKLKHPYILCDCQEELLTKINSGKKIMVFQELEKEEHKECEFPLIDSEDIVYIQFSSGSTGDPKGVVLRNRNLVYNIEQIIKRTNITNEDSFFSWMPLTHDMGLIGFHITPLYQGINQFRMEPSVFIKRPNMFLEKISKFSATMTSSPNFALKWMIERKSERKLQNVDLSSIKLIYDGAEPISMDVIRNYEKNFIAYGLKKDVIYQVYGLAEACLAVAFLEPKEKEKSVYINRKNNRIGAKVELVDCNHKDFSEFAIVGSPLDGITIRIEDDENVVLDELHIGRIMIKGRNVFEGYLENNEKDLWDKEYFDTGDLGFIYKNKLVVTGRKKDIIFINGQNYFAHDLENVISESKIENVKEVAVVADYDTIHGKDEIYVFIRFRGTKEEFEPCIDLVKKFCLQEFNFVPKGVLPLKVIPKTTSGKPKRYLLLQNLINGEYEIVDALK